MIDDLAALLADGEPVTLTLPTTGHARKAGLALRPGLEARGIRVRIYTAANTVTLERIPA